MNHKFTQGAGTILKPQNYEFHWKAELKDQSVINMFGPTGDYETKVPFTFVQEQQPNLSHIIWQSLENPEMHLGVCFNGPLPVFMLAGKLYEPILASYYSGHNYLAKFFIRNSGLLSTNGFNKDTIVSDFSMAYHAGFKFKFKEQEMLLSVSWDGESFGKHGFDNMQEVGRYILS